MITEEIRETLFGLQDKAYRDFQGKLIPTLGQDRMIGVRTPELRNLAKQLQKREEISLFLQDLPHRYFDENQLHAFIVSEIRDYGTCVEEVDRFLPFVDNWATCDQMSPKIFKKKHMELLPEISGWILSEQTYTVRFAIGLLMKHFLDEDFCMDYPGMVAEVSSEEYYINMMVAWYFATALAKQYDSVIPFLEENRLDAWTHHMTIRKAVESRRVTPEHKEYLLTLPVRESKIKKEIRMDAGKEGGKQDDRKD